MVQRNCMHKRIEMAVIYAHKRLLYNFHSKKYLIEYVDNTD